MTAAWQDLTAHGLIDETVPACRAGYSRFVTRAPGTGQPRWLGDVQLSSMLFNWAHLYQSLRRRVPDRLYRSDAAVERIEATPHGPTLHLVPGGSLDFDLVVCADGYRSLGRGLIDPGAAPAYRGMVLWRGLLPERDTPRRRPRRLRSSATRVPGGPRGRVLHPRTRAEHRTGKAPSHVGLLPPGSRKRPGLGARRRSRAAAVRLGAVREGASGGQGGPGVPPRGPAAPDAVRVGAAERQLLDPGHLLLCAPQLRTRSPLPGRRCRHAGPPVRRERRPAGGGQCRLFGGRPRRSAGHR